MAESNIQSTVEAVWRMESAKIIAKLARMLRDVSLAEELAQGARVPALEQGPTAVIQNHPGAWLMVTAKNRALDQLRRFKLLQRKHQPISQAPGLFGMPAVGHCSSAVTSASCASSSARPTSRNMRASFAMILADSMRHTASTVLWMLDSTMARAPRPRPHSKHGPSSPTSIG